RLEVADAEARGHRERDEDEQRKDRRAPALARRPEAHVAMAAARGRKQHRPRPDGATSRARHTGVLSRERRQGAGWWMTGAARTVSRTACTAIRPRGARRRQT